MGGSGKGWKSWLAESLFERDFLAYISEGP